MESLQPKHMIDTPTPYIVGPFTGPHLCGLTSQSVEARYLDAFVQGNPQRSNVRECSPSLAAGAGAYQPRVVERTHTLRRRTGPLRHLNQSPVVNLKLRENALPSLVPCKLTK